MGDALPSFDDQAGAIQGVQMSMKKEIDELSKAIDSTLENVANLRSENSLLRSINSELVKALEKIIDESKLGIRYHSIGPGYYESILEEANTALERAKQ